MSSTARTARCRSIRTLISAAPSATTMTAAHLRLDLLEHDGFVAAAARHGRRLRALGRLLRRAAAAVAVAALRAGAVHVRGHGRHDFAARVIRDHHLHAGRPRGCSRAPPAAVVSSSASDAAAVTCTSPCACPAPSVRVPAKNSATHQHRDAAIHQQLHAPVLPHSLQQPPPEPRRLRRAHGRARSRVPLHIRSPSAPACAPHSMPGRPCQKALSFKTYTPNASNMRTISVTAAETNAQADSRRRRAAKVAVRHQQLRRPGKQGT